MDCLLVEGQSQIDQLLAVVLGGLGIDGLLGDVDELLLARRSAPRPDAAVDDVLEQILVLLGDHLPLERVVLSAASWMAAW